MGLAVNMVQGLRDQPGRSGQSTWLLGGGVRGGAKKGLSGSPGVDESNGPGAPRGVGHSSINGLGCPKGTKSTGRLVGLDDVEYLTWATIINP